MPPKAKGDKKIEMEKEEEENEGGGAETTMETEVHAAVAAEMGKVNATIEKQMKDGMDRMLKMLTELQSSLSVGERLRAEKAAVIIQAFLRTTAVRVKLDRAKYLWHVMKGCGVLVCPGTKFCSRLQSFVLRGSAECRWDRGESSGAELKS